MKDKIQYLFFKLRLNLLNLPLICPVLMIILRFFTFYKQVYKDKSGC